MDYRTTLLDISLQDAKRRGATVTKTAQEIVDEWDAEDAALTDARKILDECNDEFTNA